MGIKVAINDAWGGFSLPEEVLNRYNELAGTKEAYCWDIPRHDPHLIQAIEEFPEVIKKTDIVIEELPDRDTQYYIQEYDGMETLFSPSTIPWVQA